MPLVCPVCGKAAHRLVRVPSWRRPEAGPFQYVECDACGARALVDKVSLSDFYGSAYYSHQPPTLSPQQWLRAKAYAVGLWRLGPFDPFFHGALASVLRFRVPKAARLLDVGCGEGKLLILLASLGYADLTGVDPFLTTESTGNPRTIRGNVDAVNGLFDWVMLHHALEHDADPVRLLRSVRSRLTGAGRVIVRTPVLDSWAAEVRGESWLQHDAPVHLVLHTRRSLAIAADRAGLRVLSMHDDATVRLTHRNPFAVNLLNRTHRGDQVCMLLGAQN